MEPYRYQQKDDQDRTKVARDSKPPAGEIKTISGGLIVTLQTLKGPKYEKNISIVPEDFSFLTIQSKKSYQVLTSRIIIIIPLNIPPK